MQSWNNLVNVALLGTAKKPVQPEALLQGELPPLPAPAEGDTEDKYLQLAAAVFNYRQCGALPLQVENLHNMEAPPEEKAYCSSMQQAILHEILDTETPALLELWLKACWKSNVLVQPGLQPTLLDIAAKQNRLQKIISICCGKRGAWLGSFNSNWQFATTTDGDDLWTTGTPDQRKKLLRLTLKQDGPTAREMLRSTWPQENAATRVEFLKILADFVAPEDETWLKGLLQDKSSKVKSEAWALLKKLPQSFITLQYKAILQAALQKDAKGVINFNTSTLQQLNEQIFASSIEKLSATRGTSDEQFILYQLMQHTPPAWLEESLQLSATELLDLFKKETQLKRFIPALADATANFKDTYWALAFYEQVDDLFIGLAPLLPPDLQDKYLVTHLLKHPDAVLQHASMRPKEWSYGLALALLKYTAQAPFRFNKGFYNGIIHLVPDAIVSDLPLLIPPDQYSRHNWYSLSDHLYRLLTLKTQLKLAFPNL